MSRKVASQVSTPLPHHLRERLSFGRDFARATSDAIAAHARDVMQGGTDLDALAQVQLVRAHVDAAVIALEHALAEAGADGC